MKLSDLNFRLREFQHTLAFIGLVFSAIGLCFSAYNTHREEVQLRVNTWNMFRHEFDHDLLKERKECGVTYGTKDFQRQYSNVMDFFETVGLLVKTGRIDSDLFDNTWSYYFAGYFRASQIYLDQERRRDPSEYEYVYFLHSQFRKQLEQAGPKNLQDFFGDEKKIPA